MARVRERPRLAAAQLLAVVVLAGAGVLVGMALADDKPSVPPATQERLERAEGSAAQSARQVRTLEARLERVNSAAARTGRRNRALRRQTRALRRDLRRTRRVLARARR